jgi:hypothetical protein
MQQPLLGHEAAFAARQHRIFPPPHWGAREAEIDGKVYAAIHAASVGVASFMPQLQNPNTFIK